jgi:hypothetical protein
MIWYNVFGILAGFAILAWILVEFVGLIFWWVKLMDKLGMHDNTENKNIESVNAMVAQMDDWPYAATRNASQHRNGG